MQNIRGCDAICSNQIALYMRFYIPRRPAHTACVYTPPLPTSYGINHTGFRRYGRLPSMEINYEVRSKTQLLLALTRSSAKQEIHYLALHQNFNVTQYFLKKVYTKSCHPAAVLRRARFSGTHASLRSSENRRSRVRRY